MDYMDAGDLRYYINRGVVFTEEQISKNMIRLRVSNEVPDVRPQLSTQKEYNP